MKKTASAVKVEVNYAISQSNVSSNNYIDVYYINTDVEKTVRKPLYYEEAIVLRVSVNRIYLKIVKRLRFCEKK